MNKTKVQTALDANQVTVTIDRLQDMLGCGICTARKIGEAAGAKIVIGKRVLWSVAKIRAYLESIAE